MYKAITHPIFKYFIPEDIEVIKENYSDDTYEIDTDLGYIRYIKNVYEYEELMKRVKEEIKEPVYSKNTFEINPFPEPTRFNLLLIDNSLEIPDETNSFYGSICYRVPVDISTIKLFKARDITLLDLQLLGYILMQICFQHRKIIEINASENKEKHGAMAFIVAILASCIELLKSKIIPFFIEQRIKLWTVRTDMIDCLEEISDNFMIEITPIINNILTGFIELVKENNIKIKENCIPEQLTINDWLVFQLFIAPKMTKNIE